MKRVRGGFDRRGLESLVLPMIVLMLVACAQATPTPTPTPTLTPVPCVHEVCPDLAPLDLPYAYPGWSLKVIAMLDMDSEQIRAQLPWERPVFDLLMDDEPVGELRFNSARTGETLWLPDDVAPGLHRISVEGGSTLEFEVREPQPPPPLPDGWTEITVPASDMAFFLSLPPGWEFESSMGYDTYGAWIRGPDGIVLMLNYGGPVGEVITSDDANYSDHEVVWEPIDEHKAQLAWPKEGKDGVTGVFIGSSYGIGINLNISTRGDHHLTDEQQATLLTIFRSVRGLW